MSRTTKKKLIWGIGIVLWIAIGLFSFLYTTPHNWKLLYLTVTIVFLGIWLLDRYYTKNSNKEKIWLKAFIDFIGPFYKGPSHRAKLSYLFIAILLIPFLIVLLSDNGDGSIGWGLIKGHFNPNYTINPTVFWGIWLTILSIFISSRVYFELVYKMKHNLEEFLTNVTQFLHETDSDDEIYFILPTLYIGAYEHKGKFFDSFKEKLIAICEDNSKKIHIAMLKYKDAGLTECCERHKELSASSNDFGSTIDNLRNFFNTDKSPLEEFHGKWKPLTKNLDTKKWCNYFGGLYEFLNQLNNYSEEQVVIEKITKDYFANGQETGLGNKDFFLFANTTAGVYYFGDVIIDAQTSIYFEGTILRNKHLKPAMVSLYNGFIKDKIDNEEEATS